MATTKETQPTKLTAAQLKKKVETQEEKIKSLTNDIVSGKYTDLVSESFSYAKTEDETVYIVTISLREKTDIEKRLDSLEKGHIANATAIDSIITDIIPGMEDAEGTE